MRGPAPIVILAALAAVLLGGAGAPAPSPSRVTPSEVLVLLRASDRAPGVAGAADEALTLGVLTERARRAGVRVREMRRLAPMAVGSAGEGPGSRAWILRYEGDEDPSRVAARLALDPAVEYAGPNHLIPLAAPPAAADPLYASQYALPMLRVPEAWSRTRGAGMLIAIIDTGVELDHPDLVDRIAVNAAERDGAPGVDDDGNGYVDDVWGYDFSDAPELPGVGDYLGRDPDPTDDYGHGTQVAGAAAATRDNGIGIAGAAPEASILAIRAGFRTSMPFLPALLQEDDAAAAILYAADRGAKILNLSWGDVIDAPLIGAAVDYARARGCLVVAGAGNTPADTSFYPAAYPGVLSVGAVGSDGTRTGFSTYGQDLDVMAPGSGVHVTALGGSYGTAGGTSFSAPLAAGVAALVWALHPNWSADQVAWRLRLSAAGAASGWNGDRGWGLVDAARATAGGASPPPVVQIERSALVDGASNAPGAARSFFGTVASAGLWDWTFSVAPEPSAAWSGGPDAALPGERVLARDVAIQEVAGWLGVFTPVEGDSGAWIARLRARAAGFPGIEERARFTVAPAALDVVDARVEAQASGDHWEIVAWWRSSAPYRGSLATDLPGVAGAEESTFSTRHIVRLMGPIPAGAVTVRLGARAEGEVAARDLGALVVDVPSMSPPVDMPYSDAPSGTPMPRAVSWAGPARDDLFTESPPGEETYGVVRWFEPPLSLHPLVERGSSEGLYTGIPVDAADADGDGLGELIVYRLDGWSVWEASSSESFPTQRVHLQPADGSVPVRFVTTAGGVRLLVASGTGARLYRSGASGYELVGDAEGSGGRLKLPGEVADLDGDGAPEAIFADEAGDLVVFDVGAESMERVAVQALEYPATGKFLAIPTVEHTVDVVAASIEPSGVDSELELARAGLRVSRLAWTGSGFEERAAVSLAGYCTEREVQFLDIGYSQILVRRGVRMDVLDVRSSLEWWGGLPSSTRSRVDGAVCYGPSGSDFIWLGGSTAEPGEQRRRIPIQAFSWGGLRPPRVADASLIPEGLRLRLAWETEGCGAGDLIRVTVNGQSPEQLGTVGNDFVDTLAIGSTATYEVRGAGCAWPPLSVTALAPSPPPALRWDGASRVISTFSRPLGEPPHEVRLSGAHGDVAPASVQLDRAGARLVIDFAPETAPDSLFMSGAVDTAGLPAGGAWALAMALPESPAQATPVLAGVEYFAGPVPQIIVRVEPAFFESCETPFRLDPGGLLPRISASILYPPGFILGLDEPLRAGAYTLSLRTECLPAGADSLALSRRFTVGALAYPNPLRSGEVLTLENVEPGSEVEILDVSGRVRVSWRATGERERRDLKDLPPGFYFIRMQEVAEGPRTTHKLVVLR